MVTCVYTARPMYSKRKSEPAVSARPEKRQKNEKKEDTESEEDPDEEYPYKGQKERMKKDAEQRAKSMEEYRQNKLKKQPDTPYTDEEKKTNREKIDALITRRYVMNDPNHLADTIERINTLKAESEDEEYEFEQTLYEEEIPEDRYKRACNQDEWEYTGEPSGDTTYDDLRKCVNQDTCWYLGNTDRMEELRLYRLRGTDMLLCDVCLHNGRNQHIDFSNVM